MSESTLIKVHDKDRDIKMTVEIPFGATIDEVFWCWRSILMFLTYSPETINNYIKEWSMELEEDEDE